MVSVRDNVPFPYRLRTEERIAKSSAAADYQGPGTSAIIAGVGTGINLVAGGIKSMATPKPEDNPDTTDDLPLVSAIKTVGRGVGKVAQSMATAYSNEKKRSVPNNSYDPVSSGGYRPTTGGYGPTTGGYGPTTGGYGPTKSFSKIENEEHLEKFLPLLIAAAPEIAALGARFLPGLVARAAPMVSRFLAPAAGRVVGAAATRLGSGLGATLGAEATAGVEAAVPKIASAITNTLPKIATYTANNKGKLRLAGTALGLMDGNDSSEKSFRRQSSQKRSLKKSESVMPYDINKVVRAQVIPKNELDNMGGGDFSVVFYEKQKSGKLKKIKKSSDDLSIAEFYGLLNKAAGTEAVDIALEGATGVRGFHGENSIFHPITSFASAPYGIDAKTGKPRTRQEYNTAVNTGEEKRGVEDWAAKQIHRTIPAGAKRVGKKIISKLTTP